MAVTEKLSPSEIAPLTIDEVKREYALIFKKVHRIQCARMQAEVDRQQWANRYREWHQCQIDPPAVSGNNPAEIESSQKARERFVRNQMRNFSQNDPYPDMPESDFEAEKRMAELHHLIAKHTREQSA